VTHWVRILIVANVVMFGLQIVIPELTPLLLLQPATVLMRPWTLFTYMFLHGGLWHLLFNMLALYWFGVRVENRLGSRMFIGLYLASGLGGALLSFLTPMAQILGASGAIMGIMAAYASYWPHEQFFIWGLVPVPAWLLVVIYVVMDVSGALGYGGAGIAHFGHLGGLATGWLMVKAIDRRSPARQWQQQVAGPSPGVFAESETLERWNRIQLEALHPLNRAEVIRLLAKARAHGARSLTLDERATLDRFSSGAQSGPAR